MFRYIPYIFVLFIFHSCINAPDYPDEPVIEYVGISKTTLNQNSLNTDSLFVTFSFTDGDGDLGHNPEDTTRNIFIKDLRTGNFQDKFKSPYIPEEGIGNGITGEIQLLLYTTCCIFPNNIPPCSAPQEFPLDTVTYEITIMDRSGNLSNKIVTEPIIVRCIN
ncbi:hypothetical protein [Portibacter lacus]|uniref:Uncharacterized protein n=1 Tax=Portibacter lacus TaxID=1099794 RepID=A0AA37SM31_9BACT|nr:hypothetical protein [Portibacter lacus]GLR16285.1 hypothetical protein GCM10007940_09000 [Portibacter lacus]